MMGGKISTPVVQIINWIILAAIVAVSVYFVGIDTRRRAFSWLETTAWVVVSVATFPIGFGLYFLLRTRISRKPENSRCKMKTLKRIAMPLGIVGGVWALLAPILVLLPVTSLGITPPVAVPPGHDVSVLRRPVLGWGKDMVSIVEAGTAGDALPILSFMSLMGILGLLSIVLSRRRHYLGRILLWISAIAMLAISLVSIFSLGLFFLPASILLILAAVGLREDKQTLVKGAK
jgi:hypothetical protein